MLAVVRTGTDESGRVPGDLPLIRDEAGLSAFLATQGAGTRLVLKMAEGSYGKGLLGLVVTAEGVLDAEGRRLGPAEILRHCHARRAGGGFLVQPWLEPDPALRPLMPGRALGTIRVVTVLRDDEVLLPPFSSMRIPVGANITDAFAGGKSGNLTAAVDVGTGMVGEAWGPSRDRPHRLDPCPVHPDTGVTIAGFALPHWAEVRRLVAKGARAFPQLRTLGWDVAITASGIQLLEANHHWDPHGPQIALQRGIRADMAALVAEPARRRAYRIPSGGRRRDPPAPTRFGPAEIGSTAVRALIPVGHWSPGPGPPASLSDPVRWPTARSARADALWPCRDRLHRRQGLDPGRLGLELDRRVGIGAAAPVVAQPANLARAGERGVAALAEA